MVGDTGIEPVTPTILTFILFPLSSYFWNNVFIKFNIIIMKKIKKIVNDFKSFANQGDIFTMAIGIMIGTAFKDLIDSLVNDVISPPIGFLTSGLDFTNLFITIGKVQYETLEQAQEAGAITITYGNFINSLLSFLITVFVLFVFVNQMKKLFEKREKKVKAVTKKCPYCFSEIDIRASRCSQCTSKIK